MKSKRALFQYCLSGFVILALVLTPVNAYANGGNGDAKKGSAIPMVLTIVGAVTLGVGIAKIAAQQYASGALWVAGGIAELIGASMAASNNSKTDEETLASAEGYMPDPAAPGGAPGAFPGLPPGVTLENLCKSSGGTCTCSGANCTNPKITLPSLDDLKGSLTNSYNKDPKSFPDGYSLDEALGKLDSQYGDALAAVNAFNAASDAGGLSNKSMIAGTGDLQNVKDPKDLTSGKDRPGKSNSADGTAGSGATGSDLAGRGLAGKFADSKREPVRPVNRHGLTVEDARTGRLLTIFERVSRAIRADRDRDLTLAKIEWARKELAKKNAKKNAVAKSDTVINIDPK